MAAESIKIPYAERGGELVHISVFDKGGFKPDCLCLVCKKPRNAPCAATAPRTSKISTFADSGCILLDPSLAWPGQR